ncbi:MAG: TonB-dependent receptor [Proteobacteria bacterium]|nr:TonB-dependent receptor [Pseudomonadota bacterium]
MTTPRGRLFARLAGTVVLLAAVWSPGQAALAQQAPTDASAAGTALEEIVVTGSRISLPNMTSTSPIQVVTAKDIQVSGRLDVSDVLMQLPQNFNNSFSDFNNRTSGLTTAGGLATADLRGLGPQRTLVLVNGRRLGAADPNTANPNPAPDLDQIPTALVDRVDVVTGGASSVYGSDAIAGVINFVLKRNFEGVQVDAQAGQNWHQQHSTFSDQLQTAAGYTPETGSIRDGGNKSASVVMGSSIAEGKGNVTAYFSYLRTDPVPSGNRDFGGCQLNAASNAAGNYDAAFCSGSSNSNLFNINGTRYGVLGNQFVPWNTVPTTPPAIFNAQPYIYNGRDDLRYNAGFLAHVDVQDYFKPYAEFAYMNDRTDQQIAPSALFRNANPLDPTGAGNYYINCSNPLLSAQQAGLLCTPAQIAADAASPGSVSIPVEIGRRNIEGGGRESFYEHTNYRAVLGSKGSLGAAWTYDAYGQYYYTTFYNANRQYLNFQAITNALQVTKDANGNPVCISGPPCVPYNIFKDGGVTADQLAYLYLNGTAYGSTTQRTIHADLTGDLGRYGVRSPWASNGLSVNVGYEHRSEFWAYDPDSGEESGLLSGFGGAAAPIHKGYGVDEGFVELGGAIVEDAPGIKSLVFDTGFRHSDYSTVGGADTGKFEVQYQPVQDLRLRASWQRAIRAPNLIELYNPATIGQIASGDDPCAPNEYTGVIAASLQQCQRTGVTAAQYNSGSIPQGSANQLSQKVSGNTQLKPERGTSVSVGATLSPQSLPNLVASVDYWRIELKDQITAIPPGLLLQGCLNTGDPFFCSRIVRNPANGGLVGSTVAGGGYIDQTVLNIGGIKTDGVDVQGSYRLPLAGAGALTFALNGSMLLSSVTTPYPGSPSYDCAGLFGALCQTVNPRWRHALRMTWAAPADVDVSLTWRFIGPVSLDNNSQNPLLLGRTFVNQNTGGPAIDYFNAHIPGYSYLDLSAVWNVTKGFSVRAGINNLLDKDPPLVTSEITAGGANNTFEAYDTLGRQAFVAFTARF